MSRVHFRCSGGLGPFRACVQTFACWVPAEAAGSCPPCLGWHQKAMGQQCHQGHVGSIAVWSGKECPTGPHSEAGLSVCSVVWVSCVPSAAAEMGLLVPEGMYLPILCDVCLWAFWPGTVLSLFEPSKAVCLYTSPNIKLQKFTPIWVKKCVLLPILLLWALVNTGSAFTLPPAFGNFISSPLAFCPQQRVPAFLVVFSCKLSAPFGYLCHAFCDCIKPQGEQGYPESHPTCELTMGPCWLSTSCQWGCWWSRAWPHHSAACKMNSLEVTVAKFNSVSSEHSQAGFSFRRPCSPIIQQLCPTAEFQPMAPERPWKQSHMMKAATLPL